MTKRELKDRNITSIGKQLDRKAAPQRQMQEGNVELDRWAGVCKETKLQDD